MVNLCFVRELCFRSITRAQYCRDQKSDIRRAFLFTTGKLLRSLCPIPVVDHEIDTPSTTAEVGLASGFEGNVKGVFRLAAESLRLVPEKERYSCDRMVSLRTNACWLPRVRITTSHRIGQQIASHARRMIRRGGSPLLVSSKGRDRVLGLLAVVTPESSSR